jgi:Zn ribbon nucleic-acid-binding protein
MSGFSDSVTCPNCGLECNRYSDYKPFDVVGLDCVECGFYTNTVVKQMDLEELNEMRKDQELEELAELPKWQLDSFGYITTEEQM